MIDDSHPYWTGLPYRGLDVHQKTRACIDLDNSTALFL